MVMRMLGAVVVVVLTVSACGDDPAPSATACGVNASSDATGEAETRGYIGLTSAELQQRLTVLNWSSESSAKTATARGTSLMTIGTTGSTSTWKTTA